MLVLSPINYRDSDKLWILQQLDKHREWRSLDDKRYCLVCEKIIIGDSIQIIGGTGETGPLRALCPTENCRSIPMDWVLPTDDVLRRAAERAENPQPVGARFEVPGRDKQLGLGLREGTMRWKRADR